MQARKIMIVEDESIVRLHLRRIIEAMGHEVVGLAASADEALIKAAAAPPDLVMMDINLAGVRDGVDTARDLVQAHGCAVVFATAFADDETIRRTADSGAVGYVLKPFSEQAVRAALATALSEHDRLRTALDSERSLAGIIGGLSEAVVLVDDQLRVRFTNPLAETLAGISSAQALGRPVLEVLRPAADDRPLLALALADACRNNVRALLPTASIQSATGGEALMNGAIEPVDNGGQREFVITLRDLARRVPRTAIGSGDAKTAPRMMIYSHDTFGLGHLRRSLNLAAALVAAMPDLSILLVTGSAMAHRFPLPPRVDYVKLPTVRKVAAEKYSARSLAVSDDDVLDLRTNLLLRTARDFQPDLLLVDHSPAGMRGELKPALAWLRAEHPACTTIVGLRDIIDDPEGVVDLWRQEGIYQLLEESYDRIVVYGTRTFFDPVAAYAFPARLAERVHFVGHVVEEVAVPQPAPTAVPHIVVTTGGGDGAVEAVAGAFLRMLAANLLDRPVTATILPGPLAPAEALLELRTIAVGTCAVIEEFSESTSPHMAIADLVICTGGYNTAVQALRYARRALMIPRVLHRREQLLRATLLAERGLVRCLLPDEVSPDRMASEITALLDNADEPLTAARVRGEFAFDGAAGLAGLCGSLLAALKTTTEASHD